MSKFLDQAGLIALWNKIKTLFYTKTELSDIVSHETASTISGNLTLSSDNEVVSTSQQTLTAAQQAQARANIGIDTIIGDIDSILDEINGESL